LNLRCFGTDVATVAKYSIATAQRTRAPSAGTGSRRWHCQLQ